MAFDDTPSVLFPGWTSDGTNVSFAISGFPKLSSAEAHTSTGDSRKALYALLHQIETAYAALATADKPGKLIITKSETLISGSVKREAFTFAFDLDISAADVAAE